MTPVSKKKDKHQEQNISAESVLSRRRIQSESQQKRSKKKSPNRPFTTPAIGPGEQILPPNRPLSTNQNRVKKWTESRLPVVKPKPTTASLGYFERNDSFTSLQDTLGWANSGITPTEVRLFK